MLKHSIEARQTDGARPMDEGELKRLAEHDFRFQTKCLYDVLHNDDAELSHLKILRDEPKVRTALEGALGWHVQYGNISSKKDATKIANFFSLRPPDGMSRAVRFLVSGDRDEAQRIVNDWHISIDEVERLAKLETDRDDADRRDSDTRSQQFDQIVRDMRREAQRVNDGDGAFKYQDLADRFYLDVRLLKRAAEVDYGSDEYRILRAKALNREPWRASGEAEAVTITEEEIEDIPPSDPAERFRYFLANGNFDKLNNLAQVLGYSEGDIVIVARSEMRKLLDKGQNAAARAIRNQFVDSLATDFAKGVRERSKKN